MLCKLAESGKLDVLGVGRGAVSNLPARVKFFPLDLGNQADLRSQLADFQPTHILHLAAQASVGRAADEAAATWKSNVVDLFHFVEALLATVISTTFIFISSSEVYGRAFLSGEPLTEDAALEPVGSYARTKRVGEEMLADIFAGGRIRLIVLRPFNHIGPNQDERFVVASFAAQIARIEAGLVPPRLETGNLDARRDFLDVRDVARAYSNIIERSNFIEHGAVFNVASGIPRTICSVLQDLRCMARVQFEVVKAPDRQRPSEVLTARGDSERLRKSTGWSPSIAWEQTLSDTLAAARRSYGMDG
ncbi:GDP-4-dehydro-6-deoxy-D-mannose reductase [Methylobacterium sp. BE186]|nr:GDP-4-dehydro-6-deoxy-D-mannose reductase [Methylobacterium sp. BE186]